MPSATAELVHTIMERLSEIPQVQAVALAGCWVDGAFDQGSDAESQVQGGA
jgi:hypothetical protein